MNTGNNRHSHSILFNSILYHDIAPTPVRPGKYASCGAIIPKFEREVWLNEIGLYVLSHTYNVRYSMLLKCRKLKNNTAKITLEFKNIVMPSHTDHANQGAINHSGLNSQPSSQVFLNKGSTDPQGDLGSPRGALTEGYSREGGAQLTLRGISLFYVLIRRGLTWEANARYH